eukprot:gene20453-27241_t
MSLESALEEAEKVVKRQKVCESKVSDSLDIIIESFTKARDALEAGAGVEQLMPELQASTAAKLKDATSQVKDLHTSIGKLGKILDKLGEGQPDLCKALRNIPMDKASLKQVTLEHLYREGLFEVGDKFAEEAEVEGSSALKEPYLAMHNILAEIQAGSLNSALQWAAENRAQLVVNQQHNAWPSDFEFKLHSLGFTSVLKSQGQQAAVAYAKANFQGFQGRFQKDVQRLMGCMLFVNKPLGQSLYGDLLSASAKDAVAKEFVKHTCRLMGQSCESPLALCVAAGAVAPSPPIPPPTPFVTGCRGQAVCQARVQADGPIMRESPCSDAVAKEFVKHACRLMGQSCDAVAKEFVKHACRLMGQSCKSPLADAVAKEFIKHACRLIGQSCDAVAKEFVKHDAVAKEFVKHACRLMGQSCESPLAVCVAAGAVALPALLKLAAVMERNQQDIRTAQQLPVEIELGPEDQSSAENPPLLLPCNHVLREPSVIKIAKSRTRVFKDQSSAENPPLLLPCNHVLCELSVIKIAKSRTRVFKCPYCPMEARQDNLRPLIFPE